jgi:SAM-dependent methyltransferase
MHDNVDRATVAHFGQEWTRFDQRDLPAAELKRLFDAYFENFPWDRLPADPEGFDMGCGSGRWAAFVAPRVARLHCIDVSSVALAVARRNLASAANCDFHASSFEDLPLAPESMDFGYCLGVFHHVPDPAAALRACVSKLKAGAPFLLYVYYALDDRPAWYRALWRVTDSVRRCLCGLPTTLRNLVCDCIAAVVYYPLARGSLIGERLGLPVRNVPLSFYRTHSFYVMRNDALDRFGTPLEKRMSAAEIHHLMQRAGLVDIRISAGMPCWRAVGTRRTHKAGDACSGEIDNDCR